MDFWISRDFWQRFLGFQISRKISGISLGISWDFRISTGLSKDFNTLQAVYCTLFFYARGQLAQEASQESVGNYHRLNHRRKMVHPLSLSVQKALSSGLSQAWSSSAITRCMPCALRYTKLQLSKLLFEINACIYSGPDMSRQKRACMDEKYFLENFCNTDCVYDILKCT